MTRLFTLSAVGLLGAGLMLATPQQSQAQPSVGVNLNLGRTGFSLYTGPQYLSPYVVQPVAPVGVYVNPVARTVIVKFSETNRQDPVGMFRAVSAALEP